MTVFARGRPRRAPWPDDLQLDGHGYRLGYPTRKSTQLMTVKPQDQGNVVPSEFGESAANPVFGRPLAWRDLTRGYGQKRQRGAGDGGRYYYALGVDCSVGVWIKGPGLRTATLGSADATTGVTRWFELGGLLYAVCGRYVLRWDGNVAFSVVKDFGAGKAATDAAVFASNATGTRLAFVAMGTAENLWYFDGTTWTQHASLKAVAFEANGVEFWRAGGTYANTLAKVDTNADPTNAANWTAANAFSVGSRDYGITRLVTAATGALWVFKGDGVYTIDEAGDDHELFPFLRAHANATNGEACGQFLDDTWVVYGNAAYRLRADGSLLQSGPELLAENDSPVRGYITAFCGTDFGLYAGLTNPDTGDSYLMKWGAWRPDDTGEYRLAEAWHGSLTAAFTGKRITSLYASTVAASSGHRVLWLGFSDGTVAFFSLPCSPNPTACGTYTYTSDDTDLYLPRQHFEFSGEVKTLLAAVGESDDVGATRYARFAYRTDRTDDYTDIGAALVENGRHRVGFPPGAFCTYLDPRVTLVSSAGQTPRVSGVAVEHRLRTTDGRQIYQVVVIAEDGVRRRDGTPYRVGATEISARLEAIVEAGAPVASVLPTERSRTVSVVPPLEQTIAWDTETRKPRAGIKLTIAEDTISRTTGWVDDLASFAVDLLAPYFVDDLEGS